MTTPYREGAADHDALSKSRVALGMQPKMGGKLHLKLNIGTRPIANKYREGKMKRTLKRDVKKYVKPLRAQANGG